MTNFLLCVTTLSGSKLQRELEEEKKENCEESFKENLGGPWTPAERTSRLALMMRASSMALCALYFSWTPSNLFWTPNFEMLAKALVAAIKY